MIISYGFFVLLIACSQVAIYLSTFVCPYYFLLILYLYYVLI